MKKRGQVTLFVAMALLLVASIILITFLRKSNNSPELNRIECQTDSDCVPASCCHPNSCTSEFNAPNCTSIACTLNCAPNTLDCNQGKCICQQNKCLIILNNEP